MMSSVLLGLSLASSLIVQTSKANDLDFWIGQWECDSHQPQEDGKVQVSKNLAKNTIAKILDDKVIEENFSMPGFTGKSWSSFDAKTAKWHQTWVDNSGGYLVFEGGKTGSEFVLNQIHPAPTMRMRFTDIKSDSFTWIWESKNEDGTYSLKWRLDYKRVK
ncbi:hypothetical protein QPK87_19735 [Kamptonema cortianum]|nr:hypothetical protein [Geitlerinema splendidum]MDK3158789.1 hypothetical protein [Kamptonema cortianum]